MNERNIAYSDELKILDIGCKAITKKPLFDYQKDWYWRRELNEFNLCRKSRQMGITFFNAGYDLLKSMRGQIRLILSPSLRQSTHVMDYANKWINFFSEHYSVDHRITERSKSVIKWWNGGALYALPNSASSIRGIPANGISLDEHAHFLHGTDVEIWEAILPSLTTAKQKSVAVFSTPYGEGNLFHSMDTNTDRFPNFNRVFYHYSERPDIDISIIKNNMDSLSFSQEYEGQYIGDLTTYYPLSLIKECENKDARYWTLAELAQTQYPLYGFMDVGKRRDFSVISIIAAIDSKLHLVYKKSLKTDSEREWNNQYAEIRAVMDTKKINRMFIDRTGIGHQLADTISKEYIQASGFDFTNDNKEIMFPAFRKRLENKGIVLPPDISLFSALHMIERTQIGNTVKYDSNKHTDGFGHCYDDKTEILTEDGWKFFNTLLPSDKVAALEDGICKFVSPTSYIEQNYQGEMYKIKSKYLDLVVTPNHKIYVKNHLRLSQFGLIQVNELLKTQYQFKCDMKWTGIPKQWFYLPEYIKSTRGRTPYTKKSFIKTKHWDKIKIEMDTWLQFFGYFISEGFTSTQNRIGICQNKNDILIKMRECVKKTPFQWHEKRSRATISIRTKNIQLFQYLKQFGKASNKFIPKEIKQLPKKQLNILLQALIEGDGHEGKKGCVYSTISRRLADDVQEIALKCGYVARIGVWTNFAKNSKNISPLYYVTINKKMKHGVTPTIITHKSKHNHISKEMYKGKIYCVTVPSHIIYIRRNGKPCWCGNSDEAISLITACYVYEKEGNSTPLFKGNTSTKRENIFRAREKWRKR